MRNIKALLFEVGQDLTTVMIVSHAGKKADGGAEQ